MLKALCIKQYAGNNLFKKISHNQIKFSLKTQANIKLLDISILNPGKNLPWQKLLKMLGQNNAKQILCSKNVTLPAQLGFSRFSSNLFESKLLKNTLTKTLKLANLNPKLVKIAVVDDLANCQDLVQDCLRFSNYIKVFTGNMNSYRKLQSQLFYNKGTSFLLSQDFAELGSYNLIVSPNILAEDVFDRLITFSQNSIIFACNTYDKPLPLNSFLINNFLLDDSLFSLKIKPADLTCEYFLSALFCNPAYKKQLVEVTPSFCGQKGQKLTISQVAKKFSCLVPNLTTEEKNLNFAYF